VVAATNIELQEAVRKAKFRQDLYYRLNTVPIHIPPLRTRKSDILLLFKKFALDFSERYRMPPIKLEESAQQLLENYTWAGNVRQLKNITEQISILEQERLITYETLKKYLPETHHNEHLPVLYQGHDNESSAMSERDLLYKILFDMRRDINELKHVVAGFSPDNKMAISDNINAAKNIIQRPDPSGYLMVSPQRYDIDSIRYADDDEPIAVSEVSEEPLALKIQEKELIEKALQRHHGKRKSAANELGVSERTLYRKIKEYNIEN
jgi:transcriptional regulator with PAS, ATPase and Fis domain